MNAELTLATPPTAARTPALDRYFEISLYLLLLVSVLTLVSTGKLDLFSILLPPVALLVKGYRWWRNRGPELSHRAATWLTVAYFCYFPFDLWWVSRLLSTDAQNPRLFSALLAAVHLMLFAMIVRLYSARTLRDYMFLALLAFSSMLASAILTVGSAFLAFFLVFLALCVSTFMGLEMRRTAEGSTSPPLDSGTPPAHRLHTALGIMSATIAIAALFVGSGIFFLLPRFNAGYLSRFNLQPSLITGFTDDVELGAIGQIKLSSAVVMRIKVDGGPPTRDVRWRGVALTTFDGRRWFTEERAPQAVAQGADGWIALNQAVPDNSPFAKTMHYTIYLEPMASDAMFVAAEPERIRGQLVTGGPPDSNTRRSYVFMDKTGSLSNPFHNFASIRYEAISSAPLVPPTVLRTASTEYSDGMREVYLQLPKLDPRIPALAKSITDTAKATTPYDQAHAIEMYLHAHYAYTLDLASPSAGDPLAYFLFERRAGHCEYFAAAMTVMLRSLGVPARYVNGFLAGDYNDLGGDYIVRSRDAHSWVEVFFPQYGWITFDPTPPGEPASQGFLSQLGYYWDWYQLQWSEWVINYDFLHQYSLAQGVQRISQTWTVKLLTAIARLKVIGIAWINRAQSKTAETPPWLPVSFIMLVVAAVCWRSVRLREWLALTWHLQGRDGKLSAHTAALFYFRTLRLLERHGWKKLPGQTPLEFAASLPAGNFAEPVAQLTDIYQASRFGGRGADAGRVAMLLARLEEGLCTPPSRSN